MILLSQITRLSPTSRSDNPPGYVVTVMGIDCMQLSMSLQQFPPPLVGLTCMPVVFYLLATRVGTGPALCCAAWLLVTLTLPFPTSRLQNAIWVCTCSSAHFEIWISIIHYLMLSWTMHIEYLRSWVKESGV